MMENESRFVDTRRDFLLGAATAAGAVALAGCALSKVGVVAGAPRLMGVA